MLTKLQGHGVSEAVVIKHHDFVDGFWKGVEAVQGTENSMTERFDGKSLVQMCIALSDFPAQDIMIWDERWRLGRVYDSKRVYDSELAYSIHDVAFESERVCDAAPEIPDWSLRMELTL